MFNHSEIFTFQVRQKNERVYEKKLFLIRLWKLIYENLYG